MWSNACSQTKKPKCSPGPQASVLCHSGPNFSCPYLILKGAVYWACGGPTLCLSLARKCKEELALASLMASPTHKFDCGHCSLDTLDWISLWLGVSLMCVNQNDIESVGFTTSSSGHDYICQKKLF